MGRIVVEASQQVTFIPSSYDSSNSVYESLGSVSNMYKNTSNNSNPGYVYAKKGSGADTWFYLIFDSSSIPNNVIINDVSAKVRTYQTDTTSYMTDCYAFMSLLTSVLTPTQTLTRNQNTVKTISITRAFERNELSDIRVGVHCKRPTSSSTYYNSGSSRFAMYGAELIVNYSTYHYEYDINILNSVDGLTINDGTFAVTEGDDYTITFTTTKSLNQIIVEDNNVDITSLFTKSGNTYSYTLTNVDKDHIVTINPSVIDLDEDPLYTYHTLSISSINAATLPLQGAYRAVEGSSQVVNIYPEEPTITLALDNGVDITSQLVPINQATASCAVEQRSGASYYFPLDTSTNYYTNNNASVGGSYAVSRITINTNTTCLVTIYYRTNISGNNDYLSIGNKNTALAINADNSTGTRLRTSSSNNPNFSNITFDEVVDGDFFDIRFFRKNSTSSASRKVEFYVEVTPLTSTCDYQYTVSNIQESHSLVFVFGEVTYYIIDTTTQDTGFKMLPEGKWVCLPGDAYKLTLIPDSPSTGFELIDNNTDKTSYLIEYTSTDEQNNTIKNYVYRLFNVNENHNLEVSVSQVSSGKLYLKLNSVFSEASHVYTKVSGQWQEITDLSTLLSLDRLFIYQP